jgi:mono/diheme cytochrome c family protein
VTLSRRQRIWHAVSAGVAVPLLVALAACSASVAQHTATPVPTSAQLNEHAAQGQAKFLAVGCAACHGNRGEGGIGPRSSGTTIRLEELQRLVRSGAMNGARYTNDELTDQEVANIYLWLETNPAG